MTITKNRRARRAARAVALGLAGTMAATPALAWKPYTHVYLAEQALADARDGTVEIWRVDHWTGARKEKLGDFAVDPQLLAALTAHTAQFRAGVVGPDAYPDILTGQQVIHDFRHADPHPRKSDEWLAHVWDQANDSYGGQRPVKAFAFGYLTHAAGDMFAHTYVNAFAGGQFALGDNAVRHLVVEGYLYKRTPDLSPAETGFSIDGVHDFIRQELIQAERLPGGGTVLRDRELLLIGPGEAVGDTRIVPNGELSLPAAFSRMKDELDAEIRAYYDKKRDYDRRYDEKVRAADACAWDDFSCSATVLLAEAVAIQGEKAAFMAANAAQVTYKEYWRDDIDAGLKAWPAASHEIAKAIVFHPKTQSADTTRAKAVAQGYVTGHLLSMLGAPDLVGGVIEGLDRLLNLFLPEALVRQIDAMKRDLLNTMVKNAYGKSLDEIEGLLKSPELHWDPVVDRPGGGVRMSLSQFNRMELGIPEDGYTPGAQPFSVERFAPAYNTVTMTKLMMLRQDELNRLYWMLSPSGGVPDLSGVKLGGGKSFERPKPDPDEVRAPSRRDQAMLGFIRTLDGDNQWREGMMFGGCRRYTQLFKQQRGETHLCPRFTISDPKIRTPIRPIPKPGG